MFLFTSLVPIHHCGVWWKSRRAVNYTKTRGIYLVEINVLFLMGNAGRQQPDKSQKMCGVTPPSAPTPNSLP